MQVVILCGGKGTRAYPYTDSLPKPMLPVDGTPILMHVMRIFAAQGHRSFLLAAGHRQEVIRDYFDGKHLDWTVEVVDTGEETGTGDGHLRASALAVRHDRGRQLRPRSGLQRETDTA